MIEAAGDKHHRIKGQTQGWKDCKPLTGKVVVWMRDAYTAHKQKHLRLAACPCNFAR